MNKELETIHTYLFWIDDGDVFKASVLPMQRDGFFVIAVRPGYESFDPLNIESLNNIQCFMSALNEKGCWTEAAFDKDLITILARFDKYRRREDDYGQIWAEAKAAAKVVRRQEDKAEIEDTIAFLITHHDDAMRSLARVEREERLRAEGFDEPTEDERRANLALNVSLKDWPR